MKTLNAVKVSKEQLAQMIRNQGGKFMSVQFVRARSDYRYRTLVCRTGVRKDLKTENPRPNSDPTLTNVYSISDKGYRSIATEGLVSARIDGTIYLTK
jgi:hypothetical protein